MSCLSGDEWRALTEWKASLSTRTMTSGSHDTEAIVRFLARASRSWMRACE